MGERYGRRVGDKGRRKEKREERKRVPLLENLEGWKQKIMMEVC